MSDLISKVKLKYEIAVLLERNNKLIDEWLANCIDDVIDEQPTIEAEQKHGQWIDGKCSRCGHHAPFWEMSSTYYRSRYCPNCGARMDEVTE